jgi:hypothetical protein
VERTEFQTPAGDVWLWGEPGAARGGKPIVLWISGAFAVERPPSFTLPPRLPQADVLLAHLPGNHSPQPQVHSVEAYSAAFSNVLDQLGRPAVVVGSSIGGLTALGLRSPHLRGVVALEPPLRTGQLWPLRPDFRERLAASPQDARLREFLWSVFGISETAHEDRDYTGLLDGLQTPVWAVLGGAALLPERAVSQLPSLVDEPSRDALGRHPKVTVSIVHGVGHNIPGRAFDAVVHVVEGLLSETCGATAA